MAEHRPLVLTGGVIRQLPTGDTVAGATGLPLVRTPTNITPASGATAVNVAPTLTANAFGSVYGDSHQSSRWQIDTTSDFASPVYDSGDLDGEYDPHSTSVSLAAHFDSTFVELTGKTITPVGNAAISTAQSKFGGGSAYFDGTGDYATIPTSTDFDFGGGDVTIEFWFNTTQTTTYATLLTREWQGYPHTGGWTIFLNNPSGMLQVYFTGYSTAGPFMTGTTTSHKDGNWHHLAWVKNGDDHTLFLDGVVEATATSAAAFAAGGRPLTIGNDITYGPRNFAGYIDDLRITKGVARYTTAFTPPTAAFLSLAPVTGITNTLPSNLAANTLHYWRCMYRDSDGVDSAWSTATSFTTGYPPD